VKSGTIDILTWVFLAFLIAVLAVALLPLFIEHGHGHGGRREAECIAGTLKRELRFIYRETNAVPKKRSLAVYEALDGAHGYHVAWAEYSTLDDESGMIVVHMRDREEGWLLNIFNYETGDSAYEWHEYDD
jgi:hypothetical protein